MKGIIREISESFIREAIASPRMLEDLASMEKYMSESYDGRTFVELIQNADDAQASAVKVFSAGETLIVANTGRPFNESDIMAICRSGSSNKQRGSSIGYRGVGFKSATTISNEIVIYSAGTYFTFSKKLCAKTLGKEPEKVPTVRIPFPYEPRNLPREVNEAIKHLEEEGYTTFFIFLNANFAKFTVELDGFDSGWLLFLKSICKIEIKLNSIQKTCEITRQSMPNNDLLVSVAKKNEHWYVVTDGEVSLAFKYDKDKGIIPAGGQESCFHCYLPTLDVTGFAFKVNADFSTDPSRKHLIVDELTRKALLRIEKLFADFFTRSMHSTDDKYVSLVALINTPITLTELSANLEKGIINALKEFAWVRKNNDTYVSPEKVHVLPNWLTYDEQRLIVEAVPAIALDTPQVALLSKIETFCKLLFKTGAKEVAISDISDLLKNQDILEHFEASFMGKLFVYSCRGQLGNRERLENLLVPLAEGGYIHIKDLTEASQIHVDFLNAVNSLSIKEKNTLVENFSAFTFLLTANAVQSIMNRKASLSRSSELSKKVDLAINKWKTPLQNCITVEALLGNSAKEAGKKNMECDVISVDTFGNTSYIAVKTVAEIGEAFTLTESEYDAARKYGRSYKVYLFTTSTSTIQYFVITDPANTLKLNKTVKEWSWVADSYDDETIDVVGEDGCEIASVESIEDINYDAMDGEAFEQFCARLLIKNGFEEVTLTKGSGDQGIDIIAFRDGIKHGIQCKCYSTDIGNGAVQEVFAGKTFYKCHVGIVLTNQHFSSAAIQLAEANGIVLWDREFLERLIKRSRV